MKKVRFLGAGVRARGALDLLEWQFRDVYRLEGYYEDRPMPNDLGPGGLPVFGNVEDGLRAARQGDFEIFLALGPRAAARAWQCFEQLQADGAHFARLVSPAAYVSPSARIGGNALVFPGTTIGAECSIGHLAVIFGGVTIEHNAQIGNNVLIGPGVTFSGFARVDEHAYIGVGSTLAPEAHVGCGTLVGAGSLVLGELPAHVVAYGRPAVPVRDARPGDEVPTREQIENMHREGGGAG